MLMLLICLTGELGCFGITKAVCNVRSLHNADINGKSKCLLRSRSTFKSIGLGSVMLVVEVDVTTGFGMVFVFVVVFIDACVRGNVVTGISTLDLGTLSEISKMNHINFRIGYILDGKMQQKKNTYGRVD